jgi:putative CocE/NonD family hydrolase
VLRACLLVIFSTAVLPAATPVVAPVAKLLHVRVPMRDGVHLDTNVFHPAGPGPNGGRYPVILMRTPYGKGADLSPSYQSFLDHGFALVIQDVRGRYGSEGVFEPLAQEGPDGFDTLDWIARQTWSNGKVGMIGGSYLGIAQWKLAVLNNPHLKAIFPTVSGYDDYLDRFYSTGGAMKLGHRLSWLVENLSASGFLNPLFDNYVLHLPLRTSDRAATGQTLPVYQKALDHPSYDSFWRNLSVRAHLDQVRIPVFSVGGWYDNYVESDLEAFTELRRRGKPNTEHRIMIGPWAHNMSSKLDSDFGDDAGAPIRPYQIEWFDHWLKGEPDDEPQYTPATWHHTRGEMNQAPVHIFVMGINRWRDEQDWPLARARPTALYLTGKGFANTLTGDGKLEWKPPRKDKPDEYVYDPRNPTPTGGGAVCCDPKIFPWGPVDQRPVERRPDVLVYSSDPLKHDLEVTGPVRVILYAATDAVDTDFTAKLVDVFPNGKATNLTDGILRARYRNSLEKPELLHPGEVYKLAIDAGVTSNVFLAGHRIRLEIASSNFPRFDRNPNTGAPIASETVLRKARQSVHHGGATLSEIILPVIPYTPPSAPSVSPPLASPVPMASTRQGHH